MVNRLLGHFPIQMKASTEPEGMLLPLDEELETTGVISTELVAEPSDNPEAAPGRSRQLPLQRKVSSLVQRLEAQHHEHVELGALTQAGPEGRAGFTDAEASATYFGNWQRDMNQAMGNNPITRALGHELVFEIINVLAMHKFGRQLNPRDYGVYSPREHIDNPAGQINSDLLREDQERRFRQSTEVPNQPEDISSPDAVARMFVVSDAGLPAYLGRSVQYVEEEFSTSADLGRTADGLMHLGNGLHTVEDLFAHSNFIEIAVGQLITNRAINLDADLSRELDERQQNGLDPVEMLSGRTADRAGPGGKTIPGRPIMVTGTFVTDDTLISIAEAATAFMNDFDPFSISNEQRNQQVMQMILGRYETLAGSGAAGQIVLPALSTLGQQLSTQAAEAARRAISGEQSAQGGSQPSAPENPGLWDRITSGARRVAGAVAGGAISMAGDLLQNNWVQQRIAGAINAFGNLPLVEVYKFTIDAAGKIKNFFTWLDGILQNVPGYAYLKELLKSAKEALKERLKSLITTAVRFVGSLIQKSFSEAEVEKTYIQNQINQLIATKVQDPTARRQLEEASTTEAKLALLTDPEWGARAQLSKQDMERLRQMIQSPEYVRAGASHSQIAKDHADSPFFGSAVHMAGYVNQRVRDLMIGVWSTEMDSQGHSKNEQQDKNLRQNYSQEIPPKLASRLPPTGTPESQMTDDQREALEEARQAYHFKEFERRREGVQILAQGAMPEGEEEHGGGAGYDAVIRAARGTITALQALGAQFNELFGQIEPQSQALAAELRQVASDLPAGLDRLLEEVETATSSADIQRLAQRMRQLAREKEDLVRRAQDVLRRAADVMERAGHAGAAAGRAIQQVIRQLDPLAHIAPVFNHAADVLEERGQRRLLNEDQLSQLHHMSPEQTGTWDTEFSTSHARPQAGQEMSPARQALFAFIHQVFSHPYDTDWWQPVLSEWCGRNQDRLEAYIRARNSGEMHHHEH